MLVTRPSILEGRSQHSGECNPIPDEQSQLIAHGIAFWPVRDELVDQNQVGSPQFVVFNLTRQNVSGLDTVELEFQCECLLVLVVHDQDVRLSSHFVEPFLGRTTRIDVLAPCTGGTNRTSPR